MSHPGLAFDSATPLVSRAINRIRQGPIATNELARDVFELRQAPEGLAARLVYELLGSDQRVAVDDGGIWSVALNRLESATCSSRLSDLEFAVVDVETTGSKRDDRVMEIACVTVAGGSICGRYSTLVDPGCWIPDRISRLTGIDVTMIQAAPRFEGIAAVVRRVLSGRVFVAHNARFDWRFVSDEMLRARAEIPSGDRLCTVRFAKRALPGLRRWGLDALISYYGLECQARHRAWGDAHVTAEILLNLLEVADRRGIADWDQLQCWLGGQPVGGGAADAHA
ncbi:MAG: 3'-5' exonuclease [Gemmatimonadales bacterium]|nr:MAG: 3'-5' exonuclease [Gemmatimonadales bacterium]